jgi:prepilin-type N-terminal cleavage/methylation domain-containing protein
MFLHHYLKIRNNNVDKNFRGFTLIELLVVVIIVGIFAAIAIPNFLGMFSQVQVREGMGQINGALKEAQRQAMRNGKRCKVKIDTITVDGQPRRRITTVTTADEPGSNYSGCLLSDRVLPVGIALKTTTPFGSPPKIVFSHKGNTTQSGTIIAYSPNNTTEKKCLTISNGLGIMREGDYIRDVSLSIDGNLYCKTNN